MNIKLVSFLLCPFVQRSVILLEKKQIQYQLEYIDLEQPPAWFRRLSPMGKVPLMMINGAVLFESAVILDFLDESFSPRFHPSDNLKRAQHKAWIEFGSSLLVAQHGMALAQDKEAMLEKKDRLEDELRHLLPPLEQGLFGDAVRFSLVDAAYAPLFMRLDLLARINPSLNIQYPGPVAEWAERLSSLPCVKESVVDDFPQQYRGYLEKKGAWLVMADRP
ncbi:MAG: glutathione S-transferase family protein [Candidatus Thiodiazotropha sp. (ex Lucina aurantia)]|uniref:Stringent starvation protein A n=1 Tax=Candidatus Thiodiazotropha endolucinida TaxID=1655433 RepID=A0A7Z0VPN5_9GAMM|nr:glutathione S-transferase family protein [Candidatus Thiodiazotropha endolucinida]MBT3012176.1 glutathione S-transferase family protein [Candidatus Thiodiazotropha sp. (ex Lucina pensylvanica)]MBT3022963.1 glutathione S-transferase family protein [Candidatus Thiodiazotropha taylori]MBV2100050.1 glutathione S-transferase family protein [Candidatus Thiodiazotropha sp. (ex Codakia orbicularis)]MBV2102707.1 glutathione S-transferase family protein [Candidatus Thiodiazotropha sp. (ex Lucina auran